MPLLLLFLLKSPPAEALCFVSSNIFVSILTVTAAEGYDTRSEMGKQDEDEEGKQKDGADEEEEEELNEYELQRKRRMLENQRIMLASGIVDAKDEVLKETARGIGAGKIASQESTSES